MGLLLASGQVAFDRHGNYAIVGVLALTGETRPIKGILAMALQAVPVMLLPLALKSSHVLGEHRFNQYRIRHLACKHSLAQY